MDPNSVYYVTLYFNLGERVSENKYNICIKIGILK
jgi:hypothetical protein